MFRVFGSFAVTLVFASQAFAAHSVVWTRFGEQAQDSFGAYDGAVAGVGDVDGDGIPDLVVGAPTFVHAKTGSLGRVYVLSGQGGAIIHMFDGMTPTDSFGRFVSGGDVDGDQRADVFASGFEGGRVYSGATGSLLRTIPNVTGAVPLIASAGFIDADEAVDIVYAGSSVLNADVLSGVDGSLIFQLSTGHAPATASIAEGVLLLGMNWAGGGGVARFDSSSGAPLGFIPSPDPYGLLGAAIDGEHLGDINGDSVGDVIVGAQATFYGAVYIFSGVDYSLIRSQDGSAFPEAGNFGSSVTGTGDINGDAVSDYFVGDMHAIHNGFQSGQAHLFSGLDGVEIDNWFGEGFGGSPYYFGRTSSYLGDINGDGLAEVAVGGAYLDSVTHVFHDYVSLYSFTSGSGGCQAAPHASGDVEGGSIFALYALILAGFLSRCFRTARRANGGRRTLQRSPRGARLWMGLFAVTLAPSVAGAAHSVVWTKVGTTTLETYGSQKNQLAGIGDVDGDAVPDIIAGGNASDDFEFRGHVLVLSGNSGALIYDFEGSAVNENLGRYVSGGDVNGDGRADIFAAGNEGTDVYSGADGSLMYSLPYAYSVANAGTVGPMAVPGIFQGTPSEVYDGSTGNLLFNLPFTSGVIAATPASGNLLLVCDTTAPFNHRVRTYSRLDGTWLGALAGATSDGFGSSMDGVHLGDIDGDAIDDVIIGAYSWSEGSPLTYPGRAYIYSGADLSVLRTHEGPLDPGGYSRFGDSVTGVGDVNADGVGDYLVTAPQTNTGGGQYPGRVYLYSGADGGELDSWSGEDFGGIPTLFGSAASYVGDVNGDGVAEVAISGSYITPPPSQYRYYLSLYSLAPGSGGCQIGAAGSMGARGAPILVLYMMALAALLTRCVRT